MTRRELEKLARDAFGDGAVVVDYGPAIDGSYQWCASDEKDKTEISIWCRKEKTAKAALAAALREIAK